MPFGGAVKLTGESEYRKALKSINQGLKEVTAEMKLTTASFDKNDHSAQALSKRSEDLTKKLDLQKSKLQTLKDQYAKMSDQYTKNGQKHQALVNTYNNEKAKLDVLEKTVGKTSAEYQAQKQVVDQLAQEVKKSSQAQDQNATSMSKMRVEITNAETEVVKTTKALDQLGNEEEEAGKKATESANGGFTIMKGALANLTANAIQGAINGLKQLGSALIGIGKQSIENYAQYEQLIGGVETLFGTGGMSVQEYAKSVGKSVKDVKGEYANLDKAQKEVVKNANNAYKTAGMSANEYMETVTSFSASLISSLDGDTVKASKVADMAIRDMSDNANKMGTNIQDIQNAYQGFAKQNYTMLDNLKLGYGGTKSEMERLLADAEKISGVKYDMSNLNDVYEAIHVVQQEMGITGTTAKEASQTIEGSTNAMKSAWQNLLTGMADDSQDFDQLMDNFVDSVVTLGNNLIPRIQQVIQGMGKLAEGLIEKVFPQVIQAGLDTIIPMLPQVVNLGLQIITTLIDGILQSLPSLVTAGVEMINSLLTGLGNALPSIVVAVVKVIPQIIQSLVDGIPSLINGAIQFFMAIVEAIPRIVQELAKALPKIVTSVVDGLVTGIPMLIQGAIQLLMAIVDAIPQILPPLIQALPQIVNATVSGLVSALPVLLDGAVQLFTAIVEAIPIIIKELIPQIPMIVDTVVSTLIDNFPVLLDGAIQLFMALVEAIPQILSALASALPQIVTTVLNTLTKPLQKLFGDMFKGVKKILQPMTNWFKSLWNNIKTATSNAWNTIKSAISKVINTIKSTVSNVFNSVKTTISNVWNGIKSVTSKVWNGIKTSVSSVVNGIKSTVSKVFNGVKSTVTSIFNSIKTKASSVWNGIKTAITKPIQSARDTVKTAINKIKSFFPLKVGKILSNIKMPKFTVSGGKAPWGLFGQGSLPKFGIKWNKKGAVYDDPTLLAGLGEDGAEAIVPLERNTYWIKRVAQQMKSELISMIQDAVNIPPVVVDYPNNYDTSNNVNMVDAFETALSNMKVVLDDEKVGKFVKKTVADAIYT